MFTDVIRKAARRLLGPGDADSLIAEVNALRVLFHQPRLAHHGALRDAARELADRAAAGLYRPEDPVIPLLLAGGYSPLWHARNVTFFLGQPAGLVSLWRAPAFRTELANILGPYLHIGAARTGDQWVVVVAVPETSRGGHPC